MADDVALALAVTQELRRSAGRLGKEGKGALEADLRRIERRLQGGDPYARAQDVLDLQRQLEASAGSAPPSAQAAQEQPPAGLQPPQQPQQGTPQPGQTTRIGGDIATALAAVDFVGFVSGLVTGTFRAIVDASAAQMREYANLVSSIAQTLEDFTSENVSPNQARDHLAQQYPRDLQLKLPAPGSADQPKILVRGGRAGESPEWLKKYGLEGEELSDELVEGPLLEAARKKVGEGRLSSLATMVLMGVNRVVVNEGDIRAKVQFHAAALDTQRADYAAQTGGVVQRDAGSSGQVAQMMVSTLKANAQSDAAVKADLMGEVRVSFRGESFPLERFADSAAIQLINRHAKWRTDAPGTSAAAAPAQAPAAAATVPAATVPGQAAQGAAAPPAPGGPP